jgi:hypothetical protein
MNKKIIVISIISLIVVASLAGNGYFLANNWWKAKKTQLINQGILTVFNIAKQNGFVKYTDKDGKSIKLIIQTEVSK